MDNNETQRDQERLADRPSYDVSSAVDVAFHWGLVIFSFLAPLIFLRGIHDFANLPQSAFIQVGVLLLFLVWLIKGFVGKRCFILKSPLNLPILAFVLWSLVSVIYAHNRYEAFLAWRPWAASALMFFLVMNGSYQKRRLIQLLAAVFMSGCLCALLGIGQHLLGVSWVPQVAPPAATFANKNMAAQFMVLTFPLAVGFILNSRRPIWLPLWGTASCLMIVFILYTKTRAAWVALTVEILFLFILLARERIRNKEVRYWSRKKSLALGLTFVFLFLMMNLGPKGFKWRVGEIIEHITTTVHYNLESPDRQHRSTALRVAVWRNTVEMIKDHPWIGLGLGNHKLFYPLYHDRKIKDTVFSIGSQLRRVHNDFLQTFAELGVVGMLLFAWLGFIWLRIILFLTSSRCSSDVRFWTIGITLGIVGLLVNAFFSFPFQRAIPPFSSMILIGILGSFYAGDNPKFYAIGQRWTILGSLFIVFLGLIWVVRFYYLDIKCDRYSLRLMQLERLRNWDSLVVEGEKAYRCNPGRITTLSFMGRAYIERREYGKAVEVLQKVVGAYPNHMNALVNIGIAYDRMGDNIHALDAYEKVLRIKPDYAKVHSYMANIYMRQRNLQKALEELRLAAKFDPKNSVVYFNIGALEMQNRRYQEAAVAFEKAVHLNPKWDRAHRQLGLVYLQFLKKNEEGRRHLRKALKLNPKMEDAAEISKLIGIAERQNE